MDIYFYIFTKIRIDCRTEFPGLNTTSNMLIGREGKDSYTIQRKVVLDSILKSAGGRDLPPSCCYLRSIAQQAVKLTQLKGLRSRKMVICERSSASVAAIEVALALYRPEATPAIISRVVRKSKWIMSA